MANPNILPLISQAIGVKVDFRHEIDMLFLEHRERLAGISLRHPIFNNRFFREQDLETEIYSRKVAALFNIAGDPEYERAPELMDALNDICKRAYRNIWRYVSSNRVLSGEGIERVIGLVTDNNVTAFGVLCYLGQINKNTFPISDPRFLKAYNRFITFLKASDVKPLRDTESDAIVDRMANDLMATLDDEFYGGYPPTFADWQQEPEYGKNEVLEHLLINRDFSVDTLHNVRFSRADMVEAVRMYIRYSGILNHTIEDVTDLADNFLKWYVSVLPTLGYVKLYEQARAVALSYVDKFAEHADVEATRSRLKKTAERLEVEERAGDEKQRQLNDLQLENDKLRVMISDLQGKLGDAEQEIALLTDIAQQSATVPETLPDKDISGLKILVAGGHPTWQQKVAETFPNVTVVSDNFDPALVDSCDIVAFNWLYAGHQTFYKLINRARTSGKRIVYISNNNLTKFAQLIGNSI